MNVLTQTSRYIVVLLTGIWSAGLLAAPPIEALQQTGLSSYSSLGTEQFIATLYTENRESDAVVLLNSDVAVSMEIRVVAERISQRRFSRLWIESVTVNSDARQMAIHVGNFSRFGDFFEGPLHKGDRLLIAYTPEQGMTVTLNNVELGQIKSGDFFRLLLRTWIGPIPLSSSFRRELLNAEAIDPPLRQRFNDLKPSVARIDEVKGWVSRPVAAQRRERETNNTSRPPPPSSRPASQNEPEKTAATAAGRAASSAGTAAKTAASAGAAAAAGASALSAPPKLRVAAEPQTSTTETPPPGSLEPPAAGQPRQGVRADARDNESASAGRNEQPAAGDSSDPMNESDLLLLQQYYTQFSRKVRKFQTLPKRAFQHRLEGTVRISVTIDREGEVMAVKLAEPSRHSVLNEQAFEAVESAKPFPPLPEQVSGDSYTFSVDLNYRLPY